MAKLPDLQVVYAAFDRIPGTKGAAIHVEAFGRALGLAFGPIELVTIAPETDVGGPGARWPGVRHHPLVVHGDNLIERVLSFRDQLGDWWHGRPAHVAHFRSIYEGYPLALRRGTAARYLVFEVNGLPSIELKYHYPQFAEDPELSRKVRAQEDSCIAAADLLITPSAVTAEHLVARGADRSQVYVIANGVDTDLFTGGARARPPGDPLRLLYAGTLSPWQGVHVAIEALALFRRERPATLTVVGSARPSRRRALGELAHDLGVAGQVDFLEPVSQARLANLYRGHDVALAPLVPDDRNLVQGCCPLKVLEAMAAGVPLVASDLPVVAELATNEADALLVRAGSAKGIKDALLRLEADPALGPSLAASARRRAAEQHTWRRAQDSLVELYEQRFGLRAARARS